MLSYSSEEEKEKYIKRQNAKAAAKIERQIKEDTENKKKKSFNKDYTYYQNGEQSTNPLNGFFGLIPDAECP